jgi:hypothetical protein
LRTSVSNTWPHDVHRKSKRGMTVVGYDADRACAYCFAMADRPPRSTYF